MLKYILALLLIAAVWAVVIVLVLPEWIAVVTTAVVVGFLVILFVLRKLKARKAARELEKAIAAQAQEHARSVRPEMQAEIQAMQEEFLRAIGSLKSSKVGRGGAEALYALPWYMIIGPPGAGKSTALRNSGLEFPYLSAKGGGVRGVGGTRNCEWWLTNDAVILDTAGRYTTEDDDREEWFSFLQMLRQYRPRKPMNGIIVGVSVGDIAGQGEEEIMALARRLRERIDEVMSRLQMVVPVYVMFTKCDLVDGFVDTFGNLKKTERGQIWGFTLPLGERVRQPGETFAERFDELSRVVHARTLRRLGEERRVEAREKIYGFPQQFETLRNDLSLFVGTLLQENVYQDTPIMRGVYFSSGTQEGRPIDRVMSAMAEAFGVRQRMGAVQQVTEPKSYFLRDVFSHVIFPDREVAVRSAEEVRRQRFRRVAFAAGAFGLAALISVIPLYSYFKNKELVRSTREIVANVAAHRKAATGPISLELLEPLRQRVDELNHYEKRRPPITYRFGLYTGSDLFPYVRDFYTDALRADLLEPIVRRDIDDLDDFGRRYEALESRPSGEEFARYFDKLKMHLLLTTPKAPGEPGLRDAERKWLTDQTVLRWAEESQKTPTPAQKDGMAANARLYMELASRDAKLLFPRSVSVVAKARVPMSTVPLENLAIEQLINDISKEGWDVTLTHLLGGTTAPLRSTGVVRGAFTRRAWENKVRQRLSSMPNVMEAWVLGQTSSETVTREEQLKKTRSQYFALYIQEWQQFLDTIRVDEPMDNAESLAVLQDLTRGAPPPYGKLMRGLAYNVRLEEPEAEKKGGGGGRLAKLKGVAEAKVASTAKKSTGAHGGAAIDAMRGGRGGGGGAEGEDLYLDAPDVEAAFFGFFSFGVPPEAAGEAGGGGGTQTQLDIYQEQLSFVRDALVTYNENPEEKGDALMARLQEARTRVRAQIEQQEIGWRPRFEALLWPPINGASAGATSDVAAGKGGKWCSDVVSPFGRTLAGRYPFDPNGHDAALADVAEYFRPATGTLWAFHEKSLRGDVTRVGDTFQFAKRLGTAPRFSDKLLEFLNRALEISTVLFPPGAKDPVIEFDVRIRPTPDIAEITFTVDGQTAEYHNGPEQWVTMKWPGEKKAQGAALRVRGKSGIDETIQQEGEWGLFRLLEAGTVKGDPRARVFSVVWHLRTERMDLVIDIRPARSESPFFGLAKSGPARFLSSFRGTEATPPPVIVPGGPQCPTGVK